MKVKIIWLITDNNNCRKCETKKKICKIKNKNNLKNSNFKQRTAWKERKRWQKTTEISAAHTNYNNRHNLSHSNNAGEWCVKDVHKCYHILVDQRFWLVIVGKNR